MAKKALYWTWIRKEAAKIKSDGCSGVPDFHLDCCLQHDLSYVYGKCPRSAYHHYCDDVGLYWEVADSISKREADATFRKCNQALSPFGKLSPMSWWRWAGVRIFGKGIWAKKKDK